MQNELILVVDDDPQVTSFLKRYLEKQGYRVICASDGRQMERVLERENVDLCILDIGLPGKSGLDITRDIRSGSDLPILVLSGHDEVIDRVVGLEIGADDYMVKPYEPRELLARMRTILRRYNGETRHNDQVVTPRYQFANWVLNYDDRTLSDAENGNVLELTTTEFEILFAFVTAPNTVLNRNRLLDSARGRESYPGDRAIDVHIMRLRKKLESADAPAEFIKTIHGSGYSFVANVQKLGPGLNR